MRVTVLKIRSDVAGKNIVAVGGLRPGDGWTIHQLREAIKHYPVDQGCTVGWYESRRR